MIVRDLLGQYPVQYLENIGSTIEQSGWLISVIFDCWTNLVGVIFLSTLSQPVLEVKDVGEDIFLLGFGIMRLPVAITGISLLSVDYWTMVRCFEP